MPTFTAITTMMGQAPAEALAEVLEDLDPAPYGVGTFEIEDDSGLWEVCAYFEGAPDAVVLDLLAASYGAKPFVISEVPDVDWVAHVRRELAPVEAGRFFVYGGHDADKVPDDRLALLIEASMAFGTGHHGTTLGCLRALDRLVDEGWEAKAVADIGCGTAVLAMAAAAVWPEAGPILASDIDQVAVDVARTNVAANGMQHRVACLEAAGFDAPALHDAAPYDLIFANILKGPLTELAPAMAAHVRPGGIVILSGLLTTQAEAILEVYKGVGLQLRHREDIVDWTALTLSRVY
ncbi:50S ribosomal protein L11 methyltransferase [Flavimaricola marinus]|uniref:Ribosomal protein L11 methyltransferase n=1 Tax=Flavimaricola marinus TaxID=1819565 RepID=A0A238LB31_9RHOB|nr:50S ribosomal protein L11 methyltransferase [Flavimaricola marinus]SMY06624.1 Ribosomal protein L11 methyltransferase [Flavimaricola marinus]